MGAFQFWGESAGWPLDLTPGPSPDDETAVVRRGVHVSPPLPKSAFRLRERGPGGEAKPAPKLKCTPLISALDNFWRIDAKIGLQYPVMRIGSRIAWRRVSQ